MKKLIVLVMCLISIRTTYAQERPIGLTYLDSVESFLADFSYQQPCGGNCTQEKYEVQNIGPNYYIIVRCLCRDLLFEFEYGRMELIQIPLCGIKFGKMEVESRLSSIIYVDGYNSVVLEWNVNSRGDEDEYIDQTFIQIIPILALKTLTCEKINDLGEKGVFNMLREIEHD